MISLHPSLAILLGFVLLFTGAELLVRGASRLAGLMGIPPIVIGLTVVAFGTSAPELAVSILAASRGESGIAVGNVVGSNIFNVLAILGPAALVRPLGIDNRVIARDVPIMVGVSILAFVLAGDATISRAEGAILTLGLALFLYTMRRADDVETRVEPREKGVVSIIAPTATLGVGLFLLVAGSRWLVDGASALARTLGLSELFIGLTIVAAGTSVPELATSLVAAWRNQRDIAVGNIVGSNVFNLLGVLGVSSLLARVPIEVSVSALRFDFPVMVGTAALCLIFVRSERLVSRSEGAFFLFAYALYVVSLWLDAKGAGGPPIVLVVVAAVLLAFVLWANRRQSVS